MIIQSINIRKALRDREIKRRFAAGLGFHDPEFLEMMAETADVGCQVPDTVRQPARPRDQRGWIMTPYQFGSGAPTDPSYSNVIALVHGQSATDNGPLALAVTNHGTTLNSAGVTPKWNTGSIFVSSTQVGSSGTDWVGIAHNAGFTPGLNVDFSLEIWIYPTNVATFQLIAYKEAGTSFSPWELYLTAAGKLGWFGFNSTSGTEWNLVGTTTLTANAWNFVQGRRSVKTYACALAGVQEASVTNATAAALWSDGNPVSIGNFASASAASVLGYLQDFRFTSSVARTFAVPTAEFPNS